MKSFQDQSVWTFVNNTDKDTGNQRMYEKTDSE